MLFSVCGFWNPSSPLNLFSSPSQGRRQKWPNAAEDAPLHQSFLERGGRKLWEDGHAEGVSLGDSSAQAQEPRRGQQQEVADRLADDPPQRIGLGVRKRGAGGRAGHQICLSLETRPEPGDLNFSFSFIPLQHVNVRARGADRGQWEKLARRGLFVVYRAITPAVLCYRVHYFFIVRRQIGISYVC